MGDIMADENLGVLVERLDNMKELIQLTREEMINSFKKVHARQDIANGRTGKIEIELTKAKSKVTDLDTEKSEYMTRGDCKASHLIIEVDKKTRWLSYIKNFFIWVFSILASLLLGYYSSGGA
jgi:hypothetical protein